jgi:microcystin-dependent protein
MTLTVYNSSGLQKATVSTVYDTDFIGSVKAYAGATIPANWMLCDGRALSRTAYASLFIALGGASSPWGLPDANSFNIPDLRSRMIVGTGAGTGLTARTMNGNGGEERHTLTAAELAAHSHPITDPQHTHANFQATGPGGSTSYIPPSNAILVGQATNTAANSTGITVNNNTGGGGSHENMPPWVAVAWIIKASGPQIDSGGALVGATGPVGPTGPPGQITAKGVLDAGIAGGANTTNAVLNAVTVTAASTGNYVLEASMLADEYASTGATTVGDKLVAKVDAGAWTDQAEGQVNWSVGAGLDLWMLSGTWTLALTAGTHSLSIGFQVGNSPVAIRTDGRGWWRLSAGV